MMKQFFVSATFDDSSLLQHIDAVSHPARQNATHARAAMCAVFSVLPRQSALESSSSNVIIQHLPALSDCD